MIMNSSYPSFPCHDVSVRVSAALRNGLDDGKRCTIFQVGIGLRRMPNKLPMVGSQHRALDVPFECALVLLDPRHLGLDQSEPCGGLATPAVHVEIRPGDGTRHHTSGDAGCPMRARQTWDLERSGCLG